MTAGFAAFSALARRVGGRGAHGVQAALRQLAGESAPPRAALGAQVGSGAASAAHARLSNAARLYTWSAHSRAAQSGKPARPFTGDRGHNMLFLSVDDPICRSQLFPFFYYAPELKARFGVELRETPLCQFEADPGSAPRHADTVCVQTWFDRTPQSLHGLLARIRDRNPDARIVYLDWFAPTDLRLAEALHGRVDLYVKKHVFRERAQYNVATFGDTNLMEFYGRRYHLPHVQRHYPVPTGFFERLLVGPSFAASDYMLPRFLLGAAPAGPRPIDLHARISVKGTPWYSQMRREAQRTIEAMSELSVISRAGVRRKAYLRELGASKLCFSAFGYGEVCWRDYEAVMCGALLIKPDMSHVETAPDIFQAGATYVPVRWDLADLQEKVRYYLARPAERKRITDQAFATLARYFRQQRFLEQLRSVVALAPGQTRQASPCGEVAWSTS